MKRLLSTLKTRDAGLLFVYVLYSIFSLFPGTSYSQTFYRTYGQTTVNEGGQAITLLPDGNFAVGGYKGDSAMVMKVNPAGDILWSRVFKPQNGFENVIHSLAATPDNYIIGTGNINNGATFYNFYFKIDLSGTIQWIRKFNQTQSMYFRRMWVKNASEYIMHGAVYDLSAPPYPDIMWKSVDPSSGAIMASSPRVNIIPSPAYIDDIYSSVIGRGECSYALGRTYVAGNAPASMRAFITKFDAQGNHIWSRYFMQNDIQSARIYGVDIVYDQDSLVSSYTGDMSSGGTNFTVGLFKTDTLGTLAWAKNYDIVASGAEYSVKTLKTNTGYAIVGYMSGANSDFFIISADRNGDLLWAKAYGTGANEGTKVSATNNAVVVNGDIYFTGYSTTGTNSDLVLAKVDSAGNLTCITPSNITVTVSNPPANSTLCAITTTTNSVIEVNYNGASSFQLSSNCPSLDLGNDTTICAPYTLNATTPGATQYTWSDGSSLPTLIVSAPGIYWVNVQAGCCFLTDTIVINAAGVTGTIAAIPTTCSLGYNFQVNTSGTISTWQWDFGDATNSSSANPQHNYQGPGTYTVSVLISSSCGNNTIDTVIVVQPPLTHANFTWDPDECSGSISFTNTSIAVSAYEWHFGDGSALSTAIDPLHIYVSPGSYSVMLIADPNTACADTVSVIVTAIDDSPQTQFSSLGLNCSYDVSFNNTSQNATNYEWNFGDATTSSVQDPIHSYSGPGTYSVVLISIGGACSDTLLQLISVSSLPTVTVNSPIICSGQSATLTAAGGVGYSWSTGTTGSTIAVNPTVTTSYTVTGNDLNGCTSIAIATVTVSSSGALVDLGADTLLCNQQAGILLDAGNIASATYIWNTGDTTQTILVTEPSVYWVAVTAGNCADEDTINIGLFEGIELGEDMRLCAQEELKLTPMLARNVPTTYLWSTGATSPFITVTGPDTYIVQATQGSCLFTDSVKVTGSVSEGALFIPNTFTPGPDYLNDVFYAAGEATGEFNMKIFNRWGEMIFESNKLSDGWDGTNKGHLVPAGVYVWILRYTTDCSGGTELQKKGTITVLR